MRQRSDRTNHGVLSPRLRLSILAVAVPVGAGVAALQPSPGWLVMLSPSVTRGGRGGHVLPQRGTPLPGGAGRRRVEPLAVGLIGRQAAGSSRLAGRAGFSRHRPGIIVRVPPGKRKESHKSDQSRAAAAAAATRPEPTLMRNRK